MFPSHGQNVNQREHEVWTHKSSVALMFYLHRPPTPRGCKKSVRRSLAETLALSVEISGKNRKLISLTEMNRKYESLKIAQMFDYD